MKALSDFDICIALMDEARTPAGVRAHCLAVADFALLTARALCAGGERVDAELVYFSALLHDVKRAFPDHAAAGAEFLREKGYPAAADIIARHMDIGEVAPSGVSACEIVYLADKVTREDGFCSLTDRLSLLPPDKRPYAEKRIRNAMAIQKKVEQITGRPLDEILGVRV